MIIKFLRLKVLGSGKYSKVYKCKHVETKKVYAVKVIKRTAMSESENKAIEIELAISKILNHKNILKVRDIFRSSSEIFIVMDFAKGGSLLIKS